MGTLPTPTFGGYSGSTRKSLAGGLLLTGFGARNTTGQE